LIEELLASHSTDLQQRAYELQAVIGLDARAVEAILPHDASCEDIEVIINFGIFLCHFQITDVFTMSIYNTLHTFNVVIVKTLRSLLIFAYYVILKLMLLLCLEAIELLKLNSSL
jgi:hypothetical protein